jgi:hypothetical protein
MVQLRQNLNTLTPISSKCVFGPIPDSMRICGDITVPADKITSFLAFTVNVSLFFITDTPIALLFSIRTWDQKVIIMKISYLHILIKI